MTILNVLFGFVPNPPAPPDPSTQAINKNSSLPNQTAHHPKMIPANEIIAAHRDITVLLVIIVAAGAAYCIWLILRSMPSISPETLAILTAMVLAATIAHIAAFLIWVLITRHLAVSAAFSGRTLGVSS
jgi:hypothetical protein